jgi:DnaJ-class molecular chaperone
MDATTNPVQQCSKCDGAGVIDEEDSIPCAACDGTGMIMNSPCACCDGSGWQRVMIKAICPDCLGGFF